MSKNNFLILGLFFNSLVVATPVGPMNHAFEALSELLPFIAGDEDMRDKIHEKKISTNLQELATTFKAMKHEQVLKSDVFAPSYVTINDHLQETQKAFAKGQKEYAQWRLKALTSLCLDCHSRLPESHASHYQKGELRVDESKFKNPYNLGIAQLIVRQYPEAKWTFTKVIDESLVKKDHRDTERSLKQLLLIRVKVLSEYDSMLSTVKHYLKQNGLPVEVKAELMAWEERLNLVKKSRSLLDPIRSDKDAEKVIKEHLIPLRNRDTLMLDNYDVDLLAASGQLSRYLFDNRSTKLAPEIIFWLGWSEKVLRRESFFGSGELFLKQCVRRYPGHPMARDCMNELRESTEFEFGGSAGTHVPEDVKRELEQLENLLKQYQKKD